MGLRLLVALSLASGCGRVGFDAASGDIGTSDDGGTDSADSSDGPRGVIAPAFVHITASNDASSPGTLSVTLDNVVAGNVLVVETDVDPETTAIVSVSDSTGNIYASVPSFSNTDLTIRALLTYAVASTSGQVIVTATVGATNTSQEIRVAEYSHVSTTDPLDTIAWGAGPAGAGTDGSRTDAFVTDEPNDLIFSILLIQGIDGEAGTGFTQRSEFNFDVIQDRIEPSAGMHTAFGSAGGSGWVIGALALHGEPL